MHPQSIKSIRRYDKIHNPPDNIINKYYIQGQLASIKDQVIEAAGADVLVDAVAVSAHFYMITRIDDANGTPLDAGSVEPSIHIRDLVGVNAFSSRREAQK